MYSRSQSQLQFNAMMIVIAENVILSEPNCNVNVATQFFLSDKYEYVNLSFFNILINIQN